MSALVKEERSLLSFLAIFAAILATTVTTYVVLVAAKRVLRRIGTRGIDAGTRIVGFFVSAMGMGLIFHGLTDVLQRYGIVPR
jgi:multiple antibiotic resistance protein